MVDDLSDLPFFSKKMATVQTATHFYLTDQEFCDQNSRRNPLHRSTMWPSVRCSSFLSACPRFAPLGAAGRTYF